MRHAYGSIPIWSQTMQASGQIGAAMAGQAIRAIAEVGEPGVMSKAPTSESGARLRVAYWLGVAARLALGQGRSSSRLLREAKWAMVRGSSSIISFAYTGPMGQAILEAGARIADVEGFREVGAILRGLGGTTEVAVATAKQAEHAKAQQKDLIDRMTGGRASQLDMGLKIGLGLLVAIMAISMIGAYKHRKQLGGYAKTAGRLAISAAV